MTALAPAAASATPVPIRDVSVQVGGAWADASASIYSPPTATGCGARHLLVVYRDAPGLPRHATRSGTVNVCRDIDRGSGWSRGSITRTLNVSRWPVDTYFVCRSAWQRLSSGYESTHRVCRRRVIRGCRGRRAWCPPHLSR